MKTLAIAAAILTILVLPASAQMGGSGGGRHQAKGDSKADQKPKVDEKAYQEALKRIPDPKEKYDPWGVTKQK